MGKMNSTAAKKPGSSFSRNISGKSKMPRRGLIRWNPTSWNWSGPRKSRCRSAASFWRTMSTSWPQRPRTIPAASRLTNGRRPPSRDTPRPSKNADDGAGRPIFGGLATGVSDRNGPGPHHPPSWRHRGQVAFAFLSPSREINGNGNGKGQGRTLALPAYNRKLLKNTDAMRSCQPTGQGNTDAPTWPRGTIATRCIAFMRACATASSSISKSGTLTTIPSWWP